MAGVSGLFQSESRATEDVIFQALVWKVPVLSLEQIAGAWWGETKEPVRNAARRLGQLVAAGHLLEDRLPAKPICFPLEPVSTWNPGEPPPDFEAVSYRLVSRWKRPHRETVVYTASRRTGFRLGGRGGAVSQPDQITHDLLLAEVYLFCLREHPLIAKHWRGEDCYREERRGQKLPDAMVFDESDPPSVLLVIESGGEYDADRLRAFHTDCKARGHAYQIW